MKMKLRKKKIRTKTCIIRSKSDLEIISELRKNNCKSQRRQEEDCPIQTRVKKSIKKNNASNYIKHKQSLTGSPYLALNQVCLFENNTNLENGSFCLKPKEERLLTIQKTTALAPMDNDQLTCEEVMIKTIKSFRSAEFTIFFLNKIKELFGENTYNLVQSKFVSEPGTSLRTEDKDNSSETGFPLFINQNSLLKFCHFWCSIDIDLGIVNEQILKEHERTFALVPIDLVNMKGMINREFQQDIQKEAQQN